MHTLTHTLTHMHTPGSSFFLWSLTGMRSDTLIRAARYYYYYPFFLFGQWEAGGEWPEPKTRMETDAHWLLYLAMRVYNGEVPVVVFTVILQSAKETGETMRKRSCSIQPHGSSTARTSCAADSQVHVRDLHCCFPQRRVSSLAGRVFSRTGS